MRQNLLRHFMLKTKLEPSFISLVGTSRTFVPVKRGRAAFLRNVSSMRLCAAAGSRSIIGVSAAPKVT